MKDLLSQIAIWQQQGKKLALARVIKTWGSSPRPVGSSMIITEDMEMAGSVSGGCVEGAVLKATKSISNPHDGLNLQFGISNDEAWTVGLSCGGKLDVYLQNLNDDELFATLLEKLNHNESCVLVTDLSEHKSTNILFSPDGKVIIKDGEITISDNLFKTVTEAYKHRKNELLTEGEHNFFIQNFPRKSQLLIIGAAHITSALVKLADIYDFESVVIDPRGIFAQNTSFEIEPDQLIEEYPSEVLSKFDLDAQTYAVILSHDPKIDDDALHALLPSDVAYIGALGSKKNQAKRAARLQEAGFTEEQINKIEGPIGLNIGASGAKEIALSIMASIIKTKNGVS
ncbi:XdhC family protein [Chondrinema litorale]|uniref:XdhC family protein n=1 Tax=Chondrinema litorale TaxID=2994555 RepID=UPI0025429728|nr:XdhC family protein [Chondrinema litorale]UZR97865.1 XdhC family protein [Chondrinema litorale]